MSIPTEDAPTFLAKAVAAKVRAAKLRSEAANARQAQAAKADTAKRKSDTATAPLTPSRSQPSGRIDAKPNHAPKRIGRAESAVLSGANLSERSASAAVVDALREMAAAPHLAALAEPLLPDVWDAMMCGAIRPGLAGHPDRAMLWRILGMPWMRPQASATDQAIDEMGARLGRALARYESVRRHVPATVDAELVAEPQSPAAPKGVAHAIKDQERYPDRPADAPADAPPAEPAPVAPAKDGPAIDLPIGVEEEDGLGW